MEVQRARAHRGRLANQQKMAFLSLPLCFMSNPYLVVVVDPLQQLAGGDCPARDIEGAGVMAKLPLVVAGEHQCESGGAPQHHILWWEWAS